MARWINIQKKKSLVRFEINNEVKNVVSELEKEKENPFVFTEELEGETLLGGEMRLTLDLQKEKDQ